MIQPVQTCLPAVPSLFITRWQPWGVCSHCVSFFCLLLSYTWSILSMSTSPTHPLVKLPHSRFSDKKLERGKCVLPWRSSSLFTFPSFLSSLSLSLSALDQLTGLFFCCEQSLHTQGTTEIKLHTHCCYYLHTALLKWLLSLIFLLECFPYGSTVTLALCDAQTEIKQQPCSVVRTPVVI